MPAILKSLLDRMTASASVEATIRAWRREQMRPWRRRSFLLKEAEAEFQAINRKSDRAYLFRISGSRITQEPKPEITEDALPHREMFRQRAGHYLRFLQQAIAVYPVERDGLFVMNMDDKPRFRLNAPFFAFQKLRGDTPILIHDIDFLLHDFDAGNRPRDELAFDRKDNRAVFAGSTTGLGNTVESVRLLQNPRVAAAVFFKDKPGVDFRLPNIVQCVDEEAVEALRAIGCGQAWMDWSEQFKAKCIISMDGNGATCSRVVQALSSHAILLKYASDWRLVYFQSLKPWRHFIPIETHEDVLEVLAFQEKEPDAYRHIAQAGRDFARTYLTRDVALRYTSELLQSYLSLFR